MALGITAVTIAVLVFIFQGTPSGLTVLVIAIILLEVLGLVELIGRRPPSGHQPDLDIPAASPDDGSPYNMRRAVSGPKAPSIWP